jgi:hypothetical protein
MVDCQSNVLVYVVTVWGGCPCIEVIQPVGSWFTTDDVLANWVT